MDKKSKMIVRLLCGILCVLMVGGLLTSALLSIKAAREYEAMQTVSAEAEEDAFEDHEYE